MTNSELELITHALTSVGIGGAVALLVALRLPELTREVLRFVREIINDLRNPPKPPNKRITRKRTHESVPAGSRFGWSVLSAPLRV